jgi:hypothetical protein
MPCPSGRLEPICASQDIRLAVFVDITDGDAFGNEVIGQNVLLKVDGLSMECKG